MRARSGSEDGFTLVEVMIAILLAMIAVIGVVGLYRVQTRASSNSRHVTEAATLANDKLEQLRTQVGLPACGPTETNINELGVATGIFTRNCTVGTPVPLTYYTIQIDVSWTEEGNTKHAIVNGWRAL